MFVFIPCSILPVKFGPGETDPLGPNPFYLMIHFAGNIYKNSIVEDKNICYMYTMYACPLKSFSVVYRLTGML